MLRYCDVVFNTDIYSATKRGGRAWSPILLTVNSQMIVFPIIILASIIREASARLLSHLACGTNIGHKGLLCPMSAHLLAVLPSGSDALYRVCSSDQTEIDTSSTHMRARTHPTVLRAKGAFCLVARLRLARAHPANAHALKYTRVGGVISQHAH